MKSLKVTLCTLICCLTCVSSLPQSTTTDNEARDNSVQVITTQPNGRSHFYVNHTLTNRFNCKVTGNVTVRDVRWLYGWRNGTYTNVKNITRNHPVYSARFNFPSTDVTHVACVVEDSFGKRYNGTAHNVTIEEATVPKITNIEVLLPNGSHDPSIKPTVYKPGMKLRCTASGKPIEEFFWKTKEELSSDTYHGDEISTSEITPTPKIEEGNETTYTCRAENFLGGSEYTFPVLLREPEPTGTKKPANYSPYWKVGFGTAVGALVCCVVAGGILYVRKKTPTYPKEKIREYMEGNSSNDEDQESQYVSAAFDTRHGIKLSDLKFGKKLKSGEFGTVYFGEYLVPRDGVGPHVAIKSMKIKDRRRLSQVEIELAFEEFLKEIKIMQAIGSHPHCCQYIGAVVSDLAHCSAYLVVEYCYGGDVASYLRSFRNRSLTFIQDTQEELEIFEQRGHDCESSKTEFRASLLAKWCRDVASGMGYLHTKGILHRDLAARNTLLSTTGKVHSRDPDPDEYTVKIADFGLSRDLSVLDKDYYAVFPSNSEPRRNRPDPKLPLAWIALETLQTPQCRFTTKSDVWSFGVLMWEFFSFGGTPYEDVDLVGDDPCPKKIRRNLVSYLENGDRLEQPCYASEAIWEIMWQCWVENPNERPDFNALKECLDEVYTNRLAYDEQETDEPAPAYAVLDLVYQDEVFDEESDHSSGSSQENEHEQDGRGNAVYVNPGDL